MKKKSMIAALCALSVTLSTFGSFLNLHTATAADNDYSKLITEPFKIADGMIDESKPDIGLSKIDSAETYTVFSPTADSDHYVNGVVMTEFNGKIYCQWQSSKTDEDADDTWVAYSVSNDGKTWSAPKVLAPSLDKGYCSSGGWNVCGDTLVAYVNEWPSDVTPRGGFAYYTESKDGENWSELKPVLMNDGTAMQGIIEQDPHKLESGRIVGAAHFQPGLFANPIYTDNPLGTTGWVRAKYTNMPYTGDTSREMEPSLFVNEDGNIIMTYRDQDSTYHRLASVSTDQGETWSTSVLTNMPDSRAKQSAGNLPDGTAYLVGNSVTNKTRIPLTIATSADGKTFDHSYVLRTQSDIPATVQYPGKAKRLGYHYPKSVVIGDYLYVSYATNKEFVDYTRIPLSAISLNPDVDAPVITGIEDGGVYTGSAEFTVKDEHLKTVSVDGINLTAQDGIYKLSASDKEQIIVAEDEAGNKTTYTVMVKANDGVTANDQSKTNSSPQTGEHNMFLLYLSMFLISFTAILTISKDSKLNFKKNIK